MLEKLRAQIVRQGPGLLGKPLKFTPFALQRQVLERVLSWQFQQALDEGELSFLTERWLKVEVRDVGLTWFVTLRDDRLVVSQREVEDVSFSAEANDLVLIAARREDPDTLFFQRRLRIEGDTELGLYVKNLMDSIDLDAMPAPLRIGLLRLADFIEAGLHEGAMPADDRAPTTC